MATYKTVYTSFWTDAKIADDFSIEERYLYLYFFTNPHTNLCGCYEISIRQHIAVETGYAAEKITKLIDRLANVHKVIKYCKETKELLVVNWHRYNWTSSPRFSAALKKEVKNIKCPEFREYLTSLVNGDTVSGKDSIQEYGISSTVIDSDSDNDRVRSRATFTPPTVDEVREYCRERKNNIDAESFVDFYQGKGWMVGKSKMKDWKACVRTWEKNRDNRQQKSNSENVNDFMLSYINSQEG